MRLQRRGHGRGFQAVFCPAVYGKLGRADELLRTLEPFAESGVVFDKPQSEP